MKKCRICENELEEFVSFGQQPIANGFLLPEQYAQEYFFRMAVGFCSKCTMVQLLDQPDRELMFHENYAYFSSISRRMETHFKEFAQDIMNRFVSKDAPFVVEIGSNDGIMLKNFAAAGVPHLGIEPSANVARAAAERGITTISEFFDRALAERVRAERGQADAILAANVMCHIPTLHSVAEGVASLLKADGVLIFEDPYLGDIIEKVSYDQIYDEHVFFFSATSVERLFAGHGLELIEVAPQNVHGGSMRYVLSRKGARPTGASVAAQKAKEKSLGLGDVKAFHSFSKRVERSRDMLMGELRRLQSEGARVVGYGATSKSTTVTNYCGISPDLVEFISDTTPNKQGKYSPGVHIPVRPYEDFVANPPDVALLFAWNHGEEIMAREQEFGKNGGRWLTYVPEIALL